MCIRDRRYTIARILKINACKKATKTCNKASISGIAIGTTPVAYPAGFRWLANAKTDRESAKNETYSSSLTIMLAQSRTESDSSRAKWLTVSTTSMMMLIGNSLGMGPSNVLA